MMTPKQKLCLVMSLPLQIYADVADTKSDESSSNDEDESSSAQPCAALESASDLACPRTAGAGSVQAPSPDSKTREEFTVLAVRHQQPPAEAVRPCRAWRDVCAPCSMRNASPVRRSLIIEKCVALVSVDAESPYIRSGTC